MLNFRQTLAGSCLLVPFMFASQGSVRAEPISPLPPAVSAATAPIAPGLGTAAVEAPRRDLPARRLVTRGVLLSRHAMSYRGVRYRYGCAGPRATDCSGLTLQLMRSVGIHLPRTAREQFHCGRRVHREELQAGDLLFFNTRGGVSHVGMYIGDGRMIHAANPRKGVRIDSIESGYYRRRLVGARRLLPEGATMPDPTQAVITTDGPADRGAPVDRSLFRTDSSTLLGSAH